MVVVVDAVAVRARASVVLVDRAARGVLAERDLDLARFGVLDPGRAAIFGSEPGVVVGVDQRQVVLLAEAAPVAEALERDLLIAKGAVAEAQIEGRSGGTVVHLGILGFALDAILGAVVDVVGEPVPTVDRAVLLADLIAVPLAEFCGGGERDR